MDPNQIALEAWIWYSVAWIVIGARCLSKWMLRGAPINKDDFLAAFAICTYTIAITCLYLYNKINATLDYNGLTDEETVYYGRKLGIINILAETSIQTTLWCIKACLLSLYYQISLHTPQNMAIRIVAIYTACCYPVIIIVLYGGWCRPFSQYFLLNPEVEQCLTWRNYNIVQMSLNLSSDLAIISVPVSLILKTSFTLLKKVMLVVIFSLGAFVMIAAILMKHSVFKNPTQPVWLSWSIREVSTAVLVGNLISCIPVFRAIWDFTCHFFAKPKTGEQPMYIHGRHVGSGAELGPAKTSSTCFLHSSGETV